MTPTAVITARGEERLRAGHPWIYRSDVRDVQAAGGDTVRVANARGRTLGQALFSDRSEITLRLVSRGDEPADAELWRRRLAAASAFRDSLRIDATAYRVAHGEGDLLPSLIVDRYADVLVVQTLSQGTDRLLPQICDQLEALFAPRGILARNDPRVRLLEGLDQRVEVLRGEVPETVAIREGPIEYEVDLRAGQKTGMFLDQRENHEAAASYARGRALDCFSYHGGFAFRMASAAAEVVAIDVSDEASARIARHAARNGVTNVTARAANVFDALRELERAGERFDTIVLDPPAFARSRASLGKALSGYKEINLRALKLLAPGGYLITCSCSYHVDEARLGQVLYEASVDAHAPVAIVEKRMQSRDHPVLLGVPETYYLKCFVARRLP